MPRVSVPSAARRYRSASPRRTPSRAIVKSAQPATRGAESRQRVVEPSVAAVAHTRAAGPPADRHPHRAGGAVPGGVQAGHPLWGAGLQAGGGLPGHGSRSTSPAASTTCCSPCRCRSCGSPGGTTSRRGTKRCAKARGRPDRAGRRADPPGGRPRALGRLPGHLPPADPAARGRRSRPPGSASREHRGGRGDLSGGLLALPQRPPPPRPPGPALCRLVVGSRGRPRARPRR
jgi:hypothetical protein